MKNRKRITLLLFIFTICTYFNIVIAEEEQTNDDHAVEEKQKSDTAATIRSVKRSDVKTLEEFIPSEEVSTDKPISFPTDI